VPVAVLAFFAAATFAAKTMGRLARAVLHAEKNLRVEWRRREPRETRTRVAQPVGTEEVRCGERGVREVPRVRVLRVGAPKLGEILASAKLEIAVPICVVWRRNERAPD
jgi:hypothetical protein